MTATDTTTTATSSRVHMRMKLTGHPTQITSRSGTRFTPTVMHLDAHRAGDGRPHVILSLFGTDLTDHLHNSVRYAGSEAELDRMLLEADLPRPPAWWSYALADLTGGGQ